MSLILNLIVFLSTVVLAVEPRSSFHRSKGKCRECAVNYISHPLYGRDCNDLAYIVELSTGKPWILEFSKYWLSCHPKDDPLKYLDVNWDGVTNYEDFVILSRCSIFYKSKSGTRIHVRGCPYLRDSCIPVLGCDGKMCLSCLKRIIGD